MKIKTKELSFKIKAKSEAGTFSAYGNTFNKVDLAGDKTIKGAFTKCIQGWNAKAEMPQLLSQHGHAANPIGIITSMKEDENGLLFEGKFCIEVGTAGAEAYALVKMGALKRFSIGYNTLSEKMVDGVNELHELDVKEISLVTFACNEDSLIQSVKSAVSAGENPTRLIQKALQEAGFSNKTAKAAMSLAISSKASESKIESFKSKAENFKTKFHDIDNDGEMSLYDYTRTIVSAIRDTVLTNEDSWLYIEELYMDKAIVCIYEYSEDDEYKEYYAKVNYTVTDQGMSNMDVQVGSPTEVIRVVKWMTEEEVDKMNAAKTEETPTKSKDISPENEFSNDDIESLKTMFITVDTKSTEEEKDEDNLDNINVDEIKGWFE